MMQLIRWRADVDATGGEAFSARKRSKSAKPNPKTPPRPSWRKSRRGIPAQLRVRWIMAFDEYYRTAAAFVKHAFGKGMARFGTHRNFRPTGIARQNSPCNTWPFLRRFSCCVTKRVGSVGAAEVCFVGRRGVTFCDLRAEPHATRNSLVKSSGQITV